MAAARRCGGGGAVDAARIMNVNITLCPTITATTSARKLTPMRQ